jgi:hypothetical protein
LTRPGDRAIVVLPAPAPIKVNIHRFIWLFRELNIS